MLYTLSFDIYIYMKWERDCSIFALDIKFFVDSLEFQLNQENIHMTLNIQKVVLALNSLV